MRKRIAAALLVGALALCFAPLASAHRYDRRNSDMWLRYVAHMLHPVGIAVEYVAFRPFHWLVSQPDLDIVFGHTVTEDVTYDYYQWE
jgi:hypothetical protein